MASEYTGFHTNARMKWQWPSSEASSSSTTPPDEGTQLLPGKPQTPLLLRILRFNSLIHILGYIAFYSLTFLLQHILPSPEYGPFTWPTALILPVLLSGTLVILTPLSPIPLSLPSPHPIRPWNSLTLLLVTKGQNHSTVLRSVSEMRSLQHLDSRIRFVVLTEEGRNFNATELGIQVIFIPKGYAAPKALYKARALEYYRTHYLQDSDATDAWILHLDEETAVDEHCVLTCITFIEKSLFEWGQGLILYNTINYWSSPILTFAEILRFRDDLGRFQFQHGRVHKTIFGCHGSFLLASAKVENAATWDTPCLAEDFWFGDRIWRLGSGGGFVPAVAREQSNETLVDFMMQRRRWLRGMWKVPGAFGKFMVMTWVLSIFELPLAVVYLAGIVRVPAWVSLWMRLYFSSATFTVLFAALCSDLDARLPVWRVVWHLLLTPVWSVAVQVLQTVTVLYSIGTPAKGFHIVAKK